MTDVDEPTRAHLDTDDLAGLAMLAIHDPARRVAEAHVASCAACAATWEQAQQAMAPLAGLGRQSLPVASLDAMARRIEPAVGVAWWQRRGALVATLVLVSVAFVIAFATRGEGTISSGLKCASLELGGAFALLASATLVLRRRIVALTSALGAALASSGAVAVETWLALACHDHRAQHLLAAHSGGVVLACVVGAIVGEALSRRPLVR